MVKIGSSLSPREKIIEQCSSMCLVFALRPQKASSPFSDRGGKAVTGFHAIGEVRVIVYHQKGRQRALYIFPVREHPAT